MQKEISNQERTRIFAAYMPCLTIYGTKGSTGTYSMSGVSVSEGNALFEWDEDSEWWNVNEHCLLLLNSLDCLDFDGKKAISEIVKSWGCGPIDFDDILPWLDETLTNNGNTYADYVSGYQMQEILHKLQELGYNVGFGPYSPKDLIDSGVAKLLD